MSKRHFGHNKATLTREMWRDWVEPFECQQLTWLTSCHARRKAANYPIARLREAWQQMLSTMCVSCAMNRNNRHSFWQKPWQSPFCMPFLTALLDLHVELYKLYTSYKFKRAGGDKGWCPRDGNTSTHPKCSCQKSLLRVASLSALRSGGGRKQCEECGKNFAKLIGSFKREITSDDNSRQSRY